MKLSQQKPIGSMGLVYFTYRFGTDSYRKSGKYTSPMDPMGNSRSSHGAQFFLGTLTYSNPFLLLCFDLKASTAMMPAWGDLSSCSMPTHS